MIYMLIIKIAASKKRRNCKRLSECNIKTTQKKYTYTFKIYTSDDYTLKFNGKSYPLDSTVTGIPDTVVTYDLATQPGDQLKIVIDPGLNYLALDLSVGQNGEINSVSADPCPSMSSGEPCSPIKNPATFKYGYNQENSIQIDFQNHSSGGSTISLQTPL